MKFIEQYFHFGDHLRAILVVIVAIALGVGCGAGPIQSPSAADPLLLDQPARSDQRRVERNAQKLAVSGIAHGIYPVPCDDAHEWAEGMRASQTDDTKCDNFASLTGQPDSNGKIVDLDRVETGVLISCFKENREEIERCGAMAVPPMALDQFFRIGDQCFRMATYTERLNLALILLGEPNLAEGWPQDVETYRVTLDPSFLGPRSYRIQKTDKGVFVVFKKSVDGNECGKWIALPIVQLVQVSDEHLSHFEGLLDKAGFWEMPATISHVGLDGVFVTIEAWKGGKYHVVHRWTPADGNFKQAYEFLKRLSEYPIDDEATP